MNNINKEFGFTIMELLVVVTIVGVLASIAFPQYASYKGKAYDKHAESDLRNILTAEEAYRIEHTTYAANLSLLTIPNFTGITRCNILGATAKDFTVECFHPSGNNSYCWDGEPPVRMEIGVNNC